MKKFLLFALSFRLLTISATTYFASPNGGGNGSSPESPTTLTEGLKKLSTPGDTLYLLPGQYNLGNTPVQNLNGTAAKRIVIAGYEGMNAEGSYDAILDFRSTAYGTRGLQVKSSCTYLHIKNLTLRYSGKNNLYNEGSFCLFENLDIYGSADTGCQMKKGGDNIIKNVDSHHNFDYQTMSGTTANFGGNADGFADKQFTGNGNHYIGCRAWCNSDDGWDFFERVSSSQTIIEGCVCYQNGPLFYDMTDHPRLQTDKAWFDSKVGNTMTDRYGNTIQITLDKYPCQGNGNGFKMGGQGTNHQVTVHHCLAVANNARGFDQNNNGGTMWIYNNSAYANTVNYGFTTAYGTNTLQNNISLSSVNSDSYKSQHVAANDHNTWNSGLACSAKDFLSLDTTEILAVRQADGSLAEGSFMRLAENSALIDAGIDINIGYNGLAPDLGCYESAGEEHLPLPEDTVPVVQPEGTHAIAFVTIPGASEDQALLKHLRDNDKLWIVETNAMDASVDYTPYELIVLGCKPNSGAAGFTPLKGYNKPMLLLKPFLLKSGVWSWGTAVNTQDLSIRITDSTHPVFQNLPVTNGELQLFEQCNTNAVTAISTWTNTSGYNLLATPVSNNTYTTIAELPAGTNCNGTVLPQRMLMIGVSEYSTAHLTHTGKQLIENALYYLLGLDIPMHIEYHSTDSQTEKILYNGNIYIRHGERLFTLLGHPINLSIYE